MPGPTKADDRIKPRTALPPLPPDGDRLLRLVELIRRGWSRTLVQRLLGEPDRASSNFLNDNSPYHWYWLSRVLAAEATTEFQEAKQGILRRRSSPRSEQDKTKGFAAISPELQREIASTGGKAAHAAGQAHEFSRDEASNAGRLGGQAISKDRKHMAAIGRRGGKARAANAARRRKQGV